MSELNEIPPIQCIKMLRQLTGCGLKSGKEMIDALRQRPGAPSVDEALENIRSEMHPPGCAELQINLDDLTRGYNIRGEQLYRLECEKDELTAQIRNLRDDCQRISERADRNANVKPLIRGFIKMLATSPDQLMDNLLDLLDGSSESQQSKNGCQTCPWREEPRSGEHCEDCNAGSNWEDDGIPF